MVKIDKLQQMTKCAIYEEGEGVETLPISKYHRWDYVSMHMFITFVFSSLAFLILVGMYAVYVLEEGFDISAISFSETGVLVIVFYAAWEVVFLLITFIYYRKKYFKARKSVKGYYENLKVLNKMYRDSERNTMNLSALDIDSEYTYKTYK